MRIGILGCRGIPNNYGGFEQFAEYLSVGLVKLGHEVWVYNSKKHPYQGNKWKEVNLICCYDPEPIIGIFGMFVYDLVCLFDSRKRRFDVLLQLGYISSPAWKLIIPPKTWIMTNMDGLEWKRKMYNPLLRRFLIIAERLAVKNSDLLIADSTVVHGYLKSKYRALPEYIPYGADLYIDPSSDYVKLLGLTPRNYYLVIARMQPDNHIETIIQGVLSSKSDLPLLLIGNPVKKYGRYLERKYRSERIRFAGPVFDIKILNQLRFHAGIYFHGHSAGGTNPSLLEAMAARSPICAHDNPFNRSVLGNDAWYFRNQKDISTLINLGPCQERSTFTLINAEKISSGYQWNSIVLSYESIMLRLLREN